MTEKSMQAATGAFVADAAKSDATLSRGQLFVLVFVAGVSLKMLMLPVLLLKQVGRGGAVSLAIVLAAEVLCLCGLGLAIKLCPETDFCTLVKTALGRVGEKIAAGVLTLYFLSKSVLILLETGVFFAENLFSEFPWEIYALPLVAFCIACGAGTVRRIGRCGQLLFPFIVVSSLVIFVLGTADANYANLLPLGEGGAGAVFSGGAKYAMWYGDYSLLVAFFGSVKRTKRTYAFTVGAGVLASVSVLLFALGLMSAFSEVGDLLRVGENVSGLSRFALLGAAGGRFDLLVFCVWLMSGMLKAGMFAYAQSLFFARLTGLSRVACAVITCSLEYIVMLCLKGSAHQAFFVALAVPALVMQLLLPLLSVLLALVARKKRQNGDEQTAPAGKGEENEPR